MGIYTRRQLALLLALVTAAGAGLGFNRWRAAHPATAERLERLDREPEPAAAPAMLAREPRPTTPRDPRDERRPRAARRPRDPVVASGHVDINHATADELRTVPGIGPALAARIVAARATGGPFESVDDLRRVPGLGAARLARLRAGVTVVP